MFKAEKNGGCGRLVKGNHPKDDPVPCGTKLWFIVDKKTMKETVHLCEQCRLEENNV